MTTATDKTTEDGRLAALRSGDLFGPLVLFSEKKPPNDYSYKCVIVFRDGYEALIDGGSVHDACVKSGIAYAWREVLLNAGGEVLARHMLRSIGGLEKVRKHAEPCDIEEIEKYPWVHESNAKDHP